MRYKYTIEGFLMSFTGLAIYFATDSVWLGAAAWMFMAFLQGIKAHRY